MSQDLTERVEFRYTLSRISAGESSALYQEAGEKMTAVMNRSTVPAVPSQVCIACFIALGSVEKSVQGMRGLKEGPKHEQCATSAERRLMMYRQATTNGNGASAQQT